MYDAHLILRYSDQDKEDASIERQKARCLEVAKSLGYGPDSLKVIAYDNLSGGLPWEKRIDLLEFEEDIKAGQCKRLIVYRFDRLSRDLEVSGRLLNLLTGHAIELYDEGGKLDYMTAAGQAFFGMKAVFAGFERAMIRDRTLAGKKHKASSGRYVGGVIPLGYVLDMQKTLVGGEPNPSYCKFKLYPPHAEIVREIFHRLKRDGLSPILLAQVFQSEGRLIPEFEPEVRALMGGRTPLKESGKVGAGYRITPRIIRAIVTNRVYIGIYKWGDAAAAPSNHEPIVDEATFLAVSKRFAGDGQPRHKSASRPLTLSGLLLCSEHDTAVQAHHPKGMYVCDCPRQRGEKAHFYVSSYVLDDPIAEFVVRQCSYSGYAEEVLGRMDKDRDEWMTHMSDITKRKRSLQQQIDNLRESLALANDTEERLLILGLIKARKEAIEQADLEAKASRPSRKALGTAEITLVRSFLLNLYDYWPRLPDPLRNRFLSLILDKVEISYVKADGTFEAAIHWRTGTVQTITIHSRSRWAEPDWTHDELELLRRLWPSEPIRSLVRAFPGRNWTSIKGKAQRMGLRRHCRDDRKIKRCRWQPWEESIIREAASGAITVDDVVNKTGRSYRTVYWKAWRMGLGEQSNRKIKVTWEEKGSLPVPDRHFDISNAGMIALRTIKD